MSVCLCVGYINVRADGDGGSRELNGADSESVELTWDKPQHLFYNQQNFFNTFGVLRALLSSNQAPSNSSL